MTRLRVLMNLLFLGPAAGGVGRYACELTGALVRRSDVDVRVVTTRDGAEAIAVEPWHGDVRMSILPVRRSDRVRYVASAYAAVPGIALGQRVDVVHSPANVAPPVTPGVPSVLTLHDIIWALAGEGWGTAREIATMRRATAACIGRADRIIAISEWTRQTILDAYPLDRTRIDVVPSGVRITAARPLASDVVARLGLEKRRVILCVAQKRPYKRQDALVRALPALPSDVTLVLPGAASPFEQSLRALAADLGVGERVVFPGWITDDDLDALYAHAACCAFPSEFEGFGLPVLEAMGRGVPVVCADRAALPEAAGSAALMVNPDDDRAVASALRAVLDDAALRDRLIAAGRARAEAFTWARTADLTLAVYRRARGLSA